jgi:hypothetical protein
MFEFLCALAIGLRPSGRQVAFALVGVLSTAPMDGFQELCFAKS